MAKGPKTIKSVAGLRKQVAAWRGAGDKIALVPTMGALHDGHLSLVEIARGKADRTVVSIFVNPAQFAPNEDFKAYPRDMPTDAGKLAALGVDMIFAPDAGEVYPPDFSTRVTVSGLTEGLCGRSRPHFFGGVTTVVAKLLLMCLPDYALFGEKDYQQLLVVRRMVRDLNIPVDIVGGPIIREKDGLAMSSRNAYLSAEDRGKAPLLHATIEQAARDLRQGGEVADALESAHAALADAGFEVDYLEVRNAENLAPIAGKVDEPAHVFVAALLGKTRLIDNVPVARRK
jgi:pantoate--beta-alanine ligase